MNNNSNELRYKVTYLMDKDYNDYTSQENVKYGMFVYRENVNDKDLYICIGQNPSHSSNMNIDMTNQNIFKTLLNINIKANRYIMLNTFPIIDSNGANSINELKVDENINVTEKLICELIKLKFNIKIIFACGNSLPVYIPYINKLKTLIQKYNLGTFAFCINGDIQTHMSMQAINSKKKDINDFK